MHSKLQHPKTLMRSVVASPKPLHKKVLATKKTKQSAGFMLTPLIQERVERAKAVAKSKLVTRFSDFSVQSNLTKKTMPLAVKAAPLENIVYHSSAPILAAEPSSSKDIFGDAIEKATSHTQKLKAGPKRHHRVAKKLGVSSKVFAVSSATLAAVLLAGFYTYQTAPNAAFRVAADRAGVQASLPGYKPSGFAMKGPLQSAPGEITVSLDLIVMTAHLR